MSLSSERWQEATNHLAAMEITQQPETGHGGEACEPKGVSRWIRK